MYKANLPSMQALPAQGGDHTPRSVHRISGQRVTDIGHVHPNLVGASGLQYTANMRKVPKSLQHTIMGGGRLAVLLGHRHFFAILGTATDGLAHRSAVCGHVAVHHRLVRPVKTVFLNLACQIHMGKVVLGYHEQAAGILVNPMNDPRSDHTAHTAKGVTAVVQQRVHQRAGIIPRCRMHHHTLGLVHHQQVAVLVDHI